MGSRAACRSVFPDPILIGEPHHPVQRLLPGLHPLFPFCARRFRPILQRLIDFRRPLRCISHGIERCHARMFPLRGALCLSRQARRTLPAPELVKLKDAFLFSATREIRRAASRCGVPIGRCIETSSASCREDRCSKKIAHVDFRFSPVNTTVSPFSDAEFNMTVLFRNCRWSAVATAFRLHDRVKVRMTPAFGFQNNISPPRFRSRPRRDRRRPKVTTEPHEAH